MRLSAYLLGVLQDVDATGLPPGKYTVFFDIDGNRNGTLNVSDLVLDSVDAVVIP